MVIKRSFSALSRRQIEAVLFLLKLDAGIALSENRSMEINVLPLYIKYFVKNARKITSNIKLSSLLLLDGRETCLVSVEYLILSHSMFGLDEVLFAI